MFVPEHVNVSRPPLVSTLVGGVTGGG